MENLSINDSNVQQKPETKSTETPIKDSNHINALKFERTARWVNNPNITTTTDESKYRTPDANKLRDKIRNTTDFIWSSNIGSQKCYSTTTTEPLGNLDGASILSEYESYYTAQSDISQISDTQSLRNTQYVLCRDTLDNISTSSESSILDLQNEERMSEFERNFFRED